MTISQARSRVVGPPFLYRRTPTGTPIGWPPQDGCTLLKDLEYRLRANNKKLKRGSPSDGDAQSNYIATQRETFARDGLPIISIDARKRELVDNFKNQGTTWSQTPTP